MRRQLTLGAIVAIVLIAALEVGADRSALSRGRLLPGHHDTSCGQCHTPFGGGVRDATCVRCHERARTGPERDFRATRCVACHWDHRGDRSLPDEQLRGVCLGCHGTAEVSETGARDGPLLEFHPRHQPGPARR